MKIIPVFASILLLSFTFGCKESTEKPEKEASKPAQIDDTASTKNSFDGSYSNASGKLIITNYAADKGFYYRVMFDNPEDCEGVDYEGTATFDSKNHAVSSDDPYERDEFTFKGKKLKFEPNMSMIGMECARVLDVEFVKEK